MLILPSGSASGTGNKPVPVVSAGGGGEGRCGVQKTKSYQRNQSGGKSGNGVMRIDHAKNGKFPTSKNSNGKLQKNMAKWIMIGPLKIRVKKSWQKFLKIKQLLIIAQLAAFLILTTKNSKPYFSKIKRYKNFYKKCSVDFAILRRNNDNQLLRNEQISAENYATKIG